MPGKSDVAPSSAPTKYSSSVAMIVMNSAYGSRSFSEMTGTAGASTCGCGAVMSDMFGVSSSGSCVPEFVRGWSSWLPSNARSQWRDRAGVPPASSHLALTGGSYPVLRPPCAEGQADGQFGEFGGRAVAVAGDAAERVLEGDRSG